MTSVREGAETPLFKQNFSNWRSKDETTSLLKDTRVAPSERFSRLAGRIHREVSSIPTRVQQIVMTKKFSISSLIVMAIKELLLKFSWN